MKTVRYTIALTAVLGFLSIPVSGRMQSPSLTERPLLTGQPHPALVGIDGFRTVLFRSGADPTKDGLDWMQLKANVTGKLNQAKIQLIVSTADSIEDISELRVYINLLKLTESQQYVVRIQTSVARSVCLKEKDNPIFKADLWTLNPTFEAVTMKEMPARITEVVLGQINAFIRAYRIANPPGQPFADSKSSELDSPVSQNPTEIDKRASAGNGYVASNSSDIFHKRSCRWAKNISPENLATYKSREHAVKAGKRPCKWCKP